MDKAPLESELKVKSWDFNPLEPLDPLLQKEFPRKYRDLLKFKKKSHSSLHQQPKQSLQQPKQSLQQPTQTLASATFKTTKKYQKKQAYLAKRKSKSKSPQEETLRDHVRLGEVVQEPPKLSVIPKAKFKTPRALKDQETHSESPLHSVTQGWRKTKLKQLPASQRLGLEKERALMIARYRALKSATSLN